MNKYVVFSLLMIMFVTADDVEKEEVRKPEYDSEEDAVTDNNSYKISDENNKSEFGQIEKTHKENEESEDFNASDMKISSRSSKDDESTFTDKIDTENNRRDDDTQVEANLSKSGQKSDEVTKNENNTNKNSETKDINPDDVFRDDDTNTEQVEKQAEDTESINGAIDEPNNEDRSAPSDEPEEFVEFAKSDTDGVSENTRRMLNPVQVVPTLQSNEFSGSQTFRGTDDSYGNYVAESPPRLQPIITTADNFYNSPVYSKLLAKTPLVNTMPNQDPNNIYNSYIPSILNKNNIIAPTLLTKSREYNSFEDRTDRSIEHNQNMYPYSPYVPTTAYPDVIKNYMLGRAAGVSQNNYQPIPYYTQLFKPFNQRYGNLGYGQYTVTRYRRDVSHISRK